MSNLSDAETKPRTGWIYHLKKAEVIEHIRKRGALCDEVESIDELRKQLAALVRTQGAERKDEAEASNNSESETEDVATVVGPARTREGGTSGEELRRSTSDTESPVVAVCERVGMADNNMSTKLEFQLGQDNWEVFVERLELFFVATDVTSEEKKRALLLTKISAETYTLVRDLCAPAKPMTKTYAELTKLVADHLCPKPSEAMERCKFHQAIQTSTESVAEFVARLKNLALHCNFTDRDTALRDQVICGLRDHDTRMELFRTEALTYDTAYKIAAGRELANKNANTTANLSQGVQPKQEMNFMERGKKTQTEPGQRWKAGEKSNASRRDPARSESRGEERQQSETQRACYCCGGYNHWYKNCRHRDKICDRCNKQGHLRIMCRSAPVARSRGNEGSSSRGGNSGAQRASGQQLRYICEGEDERQSEEEGGDFLNLVAHINNEGSGSQQGNIVQPIVIDVRIEGVLIKMEMDTGAGVSVISEVNREKYFAKSTMVQTDLQLRYYDGTIIRPLGVLRRVLVVVEDNSARLDLYVLPAKGPTLIGRDWLKALGLVPFTNNGSRNTGVNRLSTSGVTEELVKMFPALFDGGIGQYNKGTLKLKLKDGARPVALKARHLPFALKEKVEKELARLESLGHIEAVGASEWATPIVPVIKANGDVRICGNFKLTLNPCLVIDKHPLPLIDEIFGVLRGGAAFSQVDLSHAYMQILVDKDSRDCLTIVTHKGYYRYKKMPEGVASGPGDFQRKMEDCLRGIPNTIAYLDNIFVTGKSEQEHYDTLKAVLRRLQECGLKVSVEKCDFLKERLELLGFVIDRNGLHKAPSKVKAMVEAPRPKNPKELASFLGLITYYARFLPNRAERLKSLYECMRAGNYEWSDECERAFEWVKKALASEKILAHYDPSEEVILACDASGYGLSAILSHRYKDGSEKPIAYASKIIPERELNRAIIDKEAGAIIFGFKKFYNYVYGREITLRTDHRPLVHIFGPKKEIPLTIASRLQRWAYFLSGFTYNIEYVRSEDNSNCDALSRLPIEDSTPVFEKDFERLNYLEDADEWGLSMTDVQRASKNCRVIARVIRFVRDGWPSTDQLSDEERKYREKNAELTVEKECLLRGSRIVIPDELRRSVLRELHGSHMGMVRMKSMARGYMWWPGIDKDIEDTANACSICVEERKNPAKTPLTPWPWPDRAWSRIHSDFLGPFYGRMYLVIIDAHSKWPEIVDMGQNTTAAKTIEAFGKLFARHGLPRHLVTDNGRQFASEEFHGFLKRYNIRHSFSPPYHPATNGAAENFVGTFKNKVTKIVREGKSVERAINLFLFDYRASPHTTTDRSPAFLLYKRELRTRFEILKPSVKDQVENHQAAQIKHRPGNRRVSFEPGDIVMVDDHRTGSRKRVKATIAKQLSPSTYEVQVTPELVWKRHTDQIVPLLQEENSQDTGTESTTEATLRRSARIASKILEGKKL